MSADMPTYRLLLGSGDVVATFEAENDQAAYALGQRMAKGEEGFGPWVVLTGEFRLARQAGTGWRTLFAWTPRPGFDRS